MDKTVFPIQQFEFNYLCREVQGRETIFLPVGRITKDLNLISIEYFLYISKDHEGKYIKSIEPEYIYYKNDELQICNNEVNLTIDMVEYIYRWIKRIRKTKEEVDLYKSIKQIMKKIELIE